MTFAEDTCIIRDAVFGEKLVSITKTSNNMFPFDVSMIDRINVALNVKENSKLWYLLFGQIE